jgi:hypothetical protein
MIKKGTWVEVEKTVLTPEDRSNAIPEDTKKTPLIMWVKGYCLDECEIGEEVEVETIIGRKEKGKVTQIEPSFDHDFGKYVSEIAYIGRQAREILFK